ncbi:MAG: FtsX-like permease family protein [Henriciella sp.]|nr:FtsX-like permease family protein [Henriciella sp.]
MRLSFKLAWRNLWRNRRRTLIVVLAMGMTMSLLVLYDGMIVGFEDAIYGNAIKLLGGNIQIRAEGYADSISDNPMLPMGDGLDVVQATEGLPHVQTVLRHVNTGGLATNRTGAYPLGIYGVEPQKEGAVSPVAKNLIAGRYLEPNDQDVVLIGRGLAAAMGLSVGDRFTMSGRSIHAEMRSRSMTVIGIYDLNMPSLERQLAYISLSEAQALYGLRDEVTEVIIFTDSVGQEASLVESLSASFSNYEISTWKSAIPELSSTIEMKNAVMTSFSFVILSIAAIGIFNILLMAIYERTREIGLLGAIGWKPRQIAWLFLLEGILIGIIGAIAGIVMGYLFTALIGFVGLDYSMFTDMVDYMALLGGKIYPGFDFGLTLQRAVMVAIVAALAALYPAVEAARREPAESLHHV